jgi:hypothetical protein
LHSYYNELAGSFSSSLQALRRCLQQEMLPVVEVGKVYVLNVFFLEHGNYFIILGIYDAKWRIESIRSNQK